MNSRRAKEALDGCAPPTGIGTERSRIHSRVAEGGLTHVSFSVLDWILVGSLGLNALFGVLHLIAGYVLYVRDRPVAAFADDPWRPTTPKQKVLLGGYFALSFAWLQVAALMLAFLFTGNPLGPWLGVIGIASFGGQSLVMRGNDAVARRGLDLHLLVLVVWTLAAFGSGRP